MPRIYSTVTCTRIFAPFLLDVKVARGGVGPPAGLERSLRVIVVQYFQSIFLSAPLLNEASTNAKAPRSDFPTIPMLNALRRILDSISVYPTHILSSKHTALCSIFTPPRLLASQQCQQSSGVSMMLPCSDGGSLATEP